MGKNTSFSKFDVFFAKLIPLMLSALMLLAGFTACGPNKEVVRKQVESQRDLGEALMQEGKNRPALREFLKAEQLDPKDVRLQNDLGLVLLALGRAEEARDHFKKALELDPKYADARNNLGSAYLVLEQWDEAISHFEALRSNLIYSTPYNPLSGLGYAYFRKGDYSQAVKYYLEAVELSPNFAIGWRGLGRVYLAQGRVKKAEKALEQAVKIAPQFAEAFFDLSNAYYRQGKRAEGAKARKKVCEILPESSLCEKARSRDEIPAPDL